MFPGKWKLKVAIVVIKVFNLIFSWRIQDNDCFNWWKQRFFHECFFVHNFSLICYQYIKLITISNWWQLISILLKLLNKNWFLCWHIMCVIELLLFFSNSCFLSKPKIVIETRLKIMNLMVLMKRKTYTKIHECNVHILKWAQFDAPTFEF